MLPSTGLFKSIICPHFENGSCCRPYCHFKHAKRDEDIEQTKQPVYTPTPRTFTPIFLTLNEPVSKKPKLEYVPTKPDINADDVQTSGIPVYIPSKNTNNINRDDEKFSEGPDSEHETTGALDDEILAEEEDAAKDRTEKESVEGKSSSDNETAKNKDVKSSKEVSNSKSDDKRHRESKSSSKERSHRDKSSSHSRSHKSSHKDHHKSSSSSSSRHKHKKSSECDKKDSNSTSSYKEKEKSSSRHSSSKSKSSSHKSHKLSSSDKEKSSRYKSASSKSRKRSQHSKSPSREKSSPIKDIYPPLNRKFGIPSPASVFDSTSDEEEIMEQCKMIFDEFNSNSNPQPTTSENSAKLEENNEKEREEKEEDDKYEDLTRKKWVAHGNAVNAKPTIKNVVRKPNHIQNAMQAIYHRQETLRKKQEEEAAAAALAVKEAEEKLKQATEALKRTENQLTPLIPRSYLTPPKPIVRTIAPVSNLLALERAKQKVEALKAAKQITPCQSAPKSGARLAHKIKVEEEQKPAPPVLEASSTKISYNVRMQYYNLMVKHCLNIYPNCEDAWDRAQTEELAVFNKCSTPIIYKNSALLTINKLRKESIEAGNVCTEKNKTVSHEVILAGKSAQSTSWSVKKKTLSNSSGSGDPFDKLPGTKAYDLIYECRLTEEQLQVNGYPRPGKKPGTAIITANKPLRPPSEDERYCSRCSKVFKLTMYETEAIDECNYHPKSTGYRRGFADNLHRCCQQPAGSLGCTYANYHVTDNTDLDKLSGFVTTIDRDSTYVPTKKDIFALDCEMCYTTNGVELTRVTVVDFNAKVVYDALVKPDNKIVDYNTIYSGITEKMLQNETRTLRDVQAVLLSMFHSKTILIGHSLESDLKALKLIHSVVVDTSVLFPHKMGPPKKRALKTLCIENLKRIIQEDEKGHNSAEDAEVCIHLVKYYLRNSVG